MGSNRRKNKRDHGLQVLGLGEPWPIYLEGIEECYLLEPLVIRGLSHSLNLGITFLQKNQLKLIFTEDGATLMPVVDGANSRARLRTWRTRKFQE